MHIPAELCVFLFWIATVPYTLSCPVGCNCSITNKNVSCVFNTVALTLPATIPNNTRLLQVQFNNPNPTRMSPIQQSMFPPGLVHLEELELRNSGQNMDIIHPIKNYAFQNLKGLERLAITNSSVFYVEPKAFQGLGSSLQELDLSYNRLHNDMTSPPFQDLNELETLILEGNLFTRTDNDLFSNLPNLHTLNIAHNKIQNVPLDVLLQQSNSLERLDLGGNPLTGFNFEHLQVLSKLEYLDLSKTGISTIPRFLHNLSSLPNLETIDLRYNNFTILNSQDVAAFKLRHVKVIFTGNPWICDCYIRPLWEWLIEGSTSVYGKPYCVSPANVKGRPVASLQHWEVENCNFMAPNIRTEHMDASIGLIAVVISLSFLLGAILLYAFCVLRKTSVTQTDKNGATLKLINLRCTTGQETPTDVRASQDTTLPILTPLNNGTESSNLSNRISDSETQSLEVEENSNNDRVHNSLGSEESNNNNQTETVFQNPVYEGSTANSQQLVENNPVYESQESARILNSVSNDLAQSSATGSNT